MDSDVFGEILSEWQLSKRDLWGFDVDLADLLKQDWAGRRIYIGAYFKESEVIWEKFRRERPKFVVWIVPELYCEQWFRDLDKSSARWIQLSYEDGHLVDEQNRSVGEFPFNTWIVKLHPEAEE